MKKLLFFSLVIPASLFPLFLFYGVYDYISLHQQKFSTYTLTEEELSMIEDGDIILRHGYGFVSDYIVDTKKEEFKVSHCAIIIKDSITGRLSVIHSVSQTLAEYDGVQTQSLQVFLNDCKKNSIIISRYKRANKEAAHKISNRAKYYLANRVPFDNKFDLFNNTEIYCTELIYLIIKDEFNDDIFSYESNTNTSDIDFKVFTDTTHFDVIINHHLNNVLK